MLIIFKRFSPYSSKDQREIRKKKVDEHELKIVEAPQISSAMFLKYNDQLGPPFHVLIDTNFINFTIKNRIDLFTGFMDCLYAKSKKTRCKKA